MDIATSHAVLSEVAAGKLGPTLRLHIPAPVVAFGRADRVTPGYQAAIRAARAHGFGAVERLAGGRAAVFHESTIAFSLAVPDAEPRASIRPRFEMISNLMVEAFESLGVDARVGELAGEYCPGQWSVNAGGLVKVMGVGQRLVRGAAHVGGVVVVDQGERIRDVLIPVYRALRIDWDPRTAGSLSDRAPGLNNQMVVAAIEERFRATHDMEERALPDGVVAKAFTLIDDHLPEVA